MHFTCQRDKLNEAISIVSKAAPVKSTVAALEGIKFKIDEGRIHLSAYDFNIAISAEIECITDDIDEIVFPAKLFGDIIRKLPNEPVSVVSDENLAVSIMCGGTEFNIMGISTEDFPELPTVSEENRLDLTVTAFKRIIKQTVYAASTLDLKPILTGILFEMNEEERSVLAVGLDQYRLALKKESYEYKQGDFKSFIVPARTLNELLKILPEESEDNIQICVSGKNVSFKFGNFTFTSRTLEGEFLNYRNVIPNQSTFTVKVKTRSLRSMIDRAALITSNAIKSPIRCDFEYDTIKLSTASNIGKFTDMISTENFGEKITVGFNNKFMLEALSAVDTEEVVIRINSELTPILIEPPEGDGFLFMVLPMRLNLDLK